MKKMLLLCTAMVIGYCSFGQNVTIVNNTVKRVGRIALITEDGIALSGVIPNIFVDALSTTGPINVGSFYTAQTGIPATPGMYVIEGQNNAGSACTGWQVTTTSTSWTAGAGCPTLNVTFAMDSSKNVTITIN